MLNQSMHVLYFKWSEWIRTLFPCSHFFVVIFILHVTVGNCNQFFFLCIKEEKKFLIKTDTHPYIVWNMSIRTTFSHQITFMIENHIEVYKLASSVFHHKASGTVHPCLNHFEFFVSVCVCAAISNTISDQTKCRSEWKERNDLRSNFIFDVLRQTLLMNYIVNKMRNQKFYEIYFFSSSIWKPSATFSNSHLFFMKE